MNNYQKIQTIQDLKNSCSKITMPQEDSHKGDNGKLMIIGGSELFHAASRWSLDIASKFVDMVFYSSIPSNNQLIQEAKQNFWNGIVVPRTEIENYINEADCVLIGPGMERQNISELNDDFTQPLTTSDWQNNTYKITNYLLNKYPDKKWVIDAGALQMVEPELLNEKCIITPHEKELEQLLQKINSTELLTTDKKWLEIAQALNKVNIIAKGKVDVVVTGATENKVYQVYGGNAGMTKGGTGDVLAGLVAGLYANNDAQTSCLWGSFVNKAAGDFLFEKVGPFFNASELVGAIPRVMEQFTYK